MNPTIQLAAMLLAMMTQTCICQLHQPTDGDTINDRNLEISFTITDSAINGSLGITMTQTSGPEDTSSPHQLNLNYKYPGSYVVTLDPTNLTNHHAITTTNPSNASLVDQAVYTLSVSYQREIDGEDEVATVHNLFYDVSTLPPSVVFDPAVSNGCSDIGVQVTIPEDAASSSLIMSLYRIRGGVYWNHHEFVFSEAFESQGTHLLQLNVDALDEALEEPSYIYS